MSSLYFRYNEPISMRSTMGKGSTMGMGSITMGYEVHHHGYGSTTMGMGPQNQVLYVSGTFQKEKKD